VDLPAVGDRHRPGREHDPAVALQTERPVHRGEPAAVGQQRHHSRRAERRQRPPPHPADSQQHNRAGEQHQTQVPGQRRPGQRQTRRSGQHPRWSISPQQTRHGHHDQRLEQRLGQHELLDVELVAIQQQRGHPEGGEPRPCPSATQRHIQQHRHRQTGQVLRERHHPKAADQPDRPQRNRVQQGTHHPWLQMLGVEQVVIGVLQVLKRGPKRQQHQQASRRPSQQQHHQQRMPAQYPPHRSHPPGAPQPRRLHHLPGGSRFGDTPRLRPVCGHEVSG